MFKKAIVLFLFIVNNVSLAQPQLDSLKNLLKQNITKKPTLERDSISTTLIRNIFNFNSRYPKYWSDSLARFAKISKWPQTIGYSFLTNGIYNHMEGNTKLSIIYLEKASEIFRKTNKKAYTLTITNITTLISLNLLNYNIADSISLKRYLNYIDESIKIANEDGEKYNISTNLITKALYYMVQNKYEIALPIFKMAHANTIKQDGLLCYNYHVSLAGQGICYLYLNREKLGFGLLNNVKASSKKNCDSENQKYLNTIICIFESKYLLKKGEFAKVKNYVLSTLKSDKHLNFPIFLNQLNNILFIAYKNLHEPQNALEYLEKVNSYKEKEENKNFTAQYAEWQTKYETEKQNSTIKTLEVNQLISQSEKNNLIRNILIASLLAGIGLFFYIYSNNLKLQTKNKELSTKNKEIEEALFKGQTIERKRIGVELHDNLSAKIGAIRWRLESLDPKFDEKTDTDFYNTTINALNETYTDVRLIAHNLLPEILEEKGLIIATQNLVNELNSLNKTKFSLEILGVGKRHPNKIEYELYSILLELSNNILKHANAEYAEIIIQNKPYELILFVKDNGVGIEKENLQYGMGLNNIKSRIESINGSLHFESEKGMNVEIKVSV